MVPTSNISQTIKRLEKELDNPLFTRNINKIALNETGIKFYKNAKSALKLLEDAKIEAQGNKKPQTIKINIQINRRVVMAAIESFQKQYPDISFITTHTIDQDIKDYDIVITDKDIKTSFNKNMILEEKLLLAYNKAAFSYLENFNTEKLRNCPFITMKSGNSIFELTQKICNDLGFSPRIVLQSEDPFYIRKCIELGLGVAIVPELSWRGQFSESVVLKKIGAYKRKVYIYNKYSANEHFNMFCNNLNKHFNIENV